MKISIWNLMRPNSRTLERNSLYAETLNKINPDIIILNETNSLIEFGDNYFSVSTKPLTRLFENYL